MVDRAALASQAQITASRRKGDGQRAESLVLLRDTQSLPVMEELARKDPNLLVDAARKAVETLRPKASIRLERLDAVLVG
jgi:hypothetical protein